VNTKEFEEKWSGIQSIVVATGIVISGIWALWVYVFSPAARHESFLRYLQTNPWPASSINVACIARTKEEWLVVANVVLENKSKDPITIDTTRKDLVLAAKVGYTQNGMLHLSAPVFGTEGYISEDEPGLNRVFEKSIELTPGRIYKTKYIVKITEPGFYQLSFYADKLTGIKDFANRVLLTESHFMLNDNDSKKLSDSGACESQKLP